MLDFSNQTMQYPFDLLSKWNRGNKAKKLSSLPEPLVQSQAPCEIGIMSGANKIKEKYLFYLELSHHTGSSNKWLLG